MRKNEKIFVFLAKNGDFRAEMPMGKVKIFKRFFDVGKAAFFERNPKDGI